jgi:hypothetical protein
MPKIAQAFEFELRKTLYGWTFVFDRNLESITTTLFLKKLFQVNMKMVR